MMEKSEIGNQKLQYRIAMPTQDANVRRANFDEVTLGYTPEMAVREAGRCLNCKKPACVSGCPVGIRIPEFIQKIRENDFTGALRIIKLNSSLSSICGRVCPQETQCESKCVRGIKGEPVAIGRLERFVSDFSRENGNTPVVCAAEPNGIRVAVVGSGPAGLSCAAQLSSLGYTVTVFEALHVAGGVLTYGIPEFRLPKKIVQSEIDALIAGGVDIQTNVVIGKTITVDELFESGYKAIFIGTGAGLPRFMGIPGEQYKGVYSANEFLTRCNLMGAWKSDSQTPIFHPRSVCVIGGGNVAMDSARTALRLGAEKVRIVYRRSEQELPARREEVEHAKEEGIEFLFLTNPQSVIGYKNVDDPRDPQNGFVTGLECCRMELGEPGPDGRRRAVEIENSSFSIECDCVIMAIGTSPNPLIVSTTPGIVSDRHGCILADDQTMKTSRERVYAGGDAVTGAATVILAMGAGRKAAIEIDKALKGTSSV